MKIYTITLSEDGLSMDAYTNIKALFNGINKTSYIPLTIDIGASQVKFNYSNLVQAVNYHTKNGKYYCFHLIVNCKYDYQIVVKELRIIKS